MSKEKITHEQAFEDLQKIVEVDQRVVGMYEVKYLRDYITQQEKQDKLLKLHKEYFNTTETIFELNKYVKLSIPNDIRKNYHKKLEQIKEKENDGITKESI